MRLKPSFDKNADSTNWWPEYVIDTNGKVCKDIEVQYDKGEDRPIFISQSAADTIEQYLQTRSDGEPRLGRRHHS